MIINNNFDKRTRKILSERIYLARKKNHLTQQELAQKCGIKRNTIYRYEKNMLSPSITILATMSEVLNVSTDYLLGLE